MADILWFNEVSMENVDQVGGKGASLGEMVRNNFPVPNGFVVTSTAYFKFIEETKIKEEIIKKIDAIDVENTAELEMVSKEIRELIIKTTPPDYLREEILSSYDKLNNEENNGANTYVAVRSSATAEDLPEASFAGQQETYLNVLGKESLMDSVRRCWASLFTARAVYYRKKQGFGTEKVGLCAVVQKMVDSEISGIMFTADPTGDLNKIIIEAGFGLGETVVSGSITPDNYEVTKENFEIKNKKINHQDYMLIKESGKNTEIKLGETKAKMQKLNDEKIKELAEIGKRIEEHYKKPMDIEWAMEHNTLYIVQARPITTLNLDKTEKSKEEKESIENVNKLKESGQETLLEGLAAAPGIVSGTVKVVPSIDDIVKVNKGDILVTTMTSPSWVPVMKKASGIITNEGGRTCHAAIVSRELSIPCVVGTEKGTEVLKDGDKVTIDGYNGVVYAGIVNVSHTEEKIEVINENEVDTIEEGLKAEAKLPIKDNVKNKILEVTKEYGNKKFDSMNSQEKEKEIVNIKEILKELGIKVKVNVALPDAAKSAASTNAYGVGLLRAEHMVTSSGVHPAEYIRQGKSAELKNVVKEGIKRVAEKFDGPVWFRTFDARSDEYKELKGGEKELNEDNPMLGWHGIRRDIDNPEMFKAQVLAVKELRQSGIKNVGIMLPFVINVDEVVKAKEIAKSVGLQDEVDFGVMIETPASVWIIDELIPHINFVSFGTNDLTQLTLGIDRNNEKVQKQFNELHPAILKQIEMVIKKCKKAGVTTSICGQAASNPDMVKKLVWMGIDSVSANIDAVEKIRDIVIVEEKKKILELLSKKEHKSILDKILRR
jgi:pyruvate,water dikinase